MPLLPKPYPDEVIGSVMARASFQAGMPMKTFLQALFGTSRTVTSFLMSGDLRLLSPLAGLDADELLLSHTMFPYAVAFMSPKMQHDLREKALNRQPSEECLGSLTKNVSHGVPERQTCETCTKEDLAILGETFWRRSHLLPGVTTCHIHGERLRPTGVPVRGYVQSTEARMPHELRAIFANVSFSDEHFQGELRAQSIRALNGKSDTEANWAARHRGDALRKGYRMVSGEVASRSLARDVFKYFGPAVLSDAGCRFSLTQLHPWPALLTREVDSPAFATPKHIFLQTFLTSAPDRLGDLGYEKPGKKTRNFEVADQVAQAKVHAILKDVTSNNERLSVKELMQRAGYWQAFRHNRSAFPLTNERIQSFRASDQSERQIGLRPCWRKNAKKS